MPWRLGVLACLRGCPAVTIGVRPGSRHSIYCERQLLSSPCSIQGLQSGFSGSIFHCAGLLGGSFPRTAETRSTVAGISLDRVWIGNHPSSISPSRACNSALRLAPTSNQGVQAVGAVKRRGWVKRKLCGLLTDGWLRWNEVPNPLSLSGGRGAFSLKIHHWNEV